MSSVTYKGAVYPWQCDHIGHMNVMWSEAWHNAGVANGGTSIEDPPGVRPNGAYLAYLRDTDGHKLVGVAR
jgi:hypothetical protein